MDRELDSFDGVTHFWCPLLGQPLHFGYCRKVGDGLPCPRVVQCFGSHFDVEAFLRQHFSEQELERCLAPAKSRLERISEALVRAKGQDGEDPS